MITCYDVIEALVRTEKGTLLGKSRQYLFRVALPAGKIAIKKSIEEIYSVKVQSINTVIVPGKRKRVRHQLGYTSDWKKAIVTLKDGQSIEVT